MNQKTESTAGNAESPPAPDRRINALLDAAETTPMPGKAQLYNQAGDICAETSRLHGRALECYGHALDGYIRVADYRAAAAMCRKIIRFSPNVVRVHFTLACLSLGREMTADAAESISNYIAAVRVTGTERFAIPRLRLMAHATDDVNIHRLIARHLAEFGDVESVGSILERNQVTDPDDNPLGDGEEGWQRLLKLALMTQDKIWKEFWLSEEPAN